MEATDPRMALDRLVEASGESYAALSRMLGRNAAYLQQYVKRGTPRLLPERDRKLLASYRRLDIAASAGPGGLAEDDRLLGSEMFDPRLLASLSVQADESAVLRAQGDSMSPTIEDGDSMLIDERDRRIVSRSGIFVIRMDGGLMVKRVAKAGERIAVTSDNADFPPIPLRGPEEIEVLGRVVWLSRALR
jgi:repressor LexA